MDGIRRRIRAVALTALAGIMAFACAPGGGGGTSEELAPDQTLRFALINDVSHLDPAQVDAAVDITFLMNTFSGLVKYDEKLKIVPDAAESMPEVSSDGLTYTFKLRKDVKFSNGDAVTSKDWVWTLNRTLRLAQAYASNLEAIKGGSAVENGEAKEAAGISAPDDYTLKFTLEQPAGYWLSQLAMPTAALVLNRKAIESTGDPDSEKWTLKPETYLGTGPYKMTMRVPGQVMEFEPVANWWGGSTGTLKKVHVDIGVDETSQVKKLEAGGYDLVGMANNPPSPDDILRYQGDPAKKKMLTLAEASRTTAVGFNFVQGPFAAKPGTTPGEPTNTGGTDPGLTARQAISLAIDRSQLADVACGRSATCYAGFGGPISKGLKGYLGDNKDPNAKFDANQAKSLLQQAGGASKFAGLQYRYNESGQNKAVAENLQSQWKANLGLDITPAPSDFPTLQRDRKAKRVIIGRQSWGADYDHPQDWFDNLWICNQAKVGRGNDESYCNPSMDQQLQKANAQPDLSKALPVYVQANEQLTKDLVWATLFYGRAGFIVQPYVKGWGFNSLYDYYWKDLSILKH